MATTVVLAGANFSIPSYGDSGWAQGAGNLSAYFISIASVTLQTTGGNFTLTADTNFGATFGLVSTYFKSRTVNIATAGIVRVADTDAIGWRNHANSANILLAKDTSDNMTWNGSPIVSSGGVVPVTAGGTGVATLTAHGVLIGEGTSNVAVTTAGSLGQPLVSGGASADPAFATLGVSGGGTGAATLTAHGVLIGGGTGSVAATAVGNSGAPLLSGGASADPAFGAVALGGGSNIVSGTLPIANGGTNSAASLSGSSIMVSNGTSVVQGGAGTSTTLLHGNASGAPTYSAVSLTADVTGVLPIANGGTAAATASANLVFAGPSSGSANAPSFRVLTVADLPPITQNSESAAYTTVLADAGKHILHPSTDNNARTFTIDSNANVAYPVGTTITFVNMINTVTVAITADTMTLMGSGSTGSRTLAASGIATALKIGTTAWVISGAGLT